MPNPYTIDCPLWISLLLYSTLYIYDSKPFLSNNSDQTRCLLYPVAYVLKYTSPLYIIITQKTRRSLFIVDSTALVIKIPIGI